VKEKLKKIIIKYYFGNKEFISLLIAFYADFKRYAKFSLIGNPNFTKEYSHARMLLLSHSLEKGLSFTPIKNEFGKKNVENLIVEVNVFLDRFPCDEISDLTIGVLNSYYSLALPNKENEIGEKIKDLLIKHSKSNDDLIGGVKEISLENLNFTNDFDALYNVAFLRSSIRNFSKREVSKLQITNAIKYAQTAPSVCNRQTSRVHIFEGEKANAILENQLGNQGWANNANKLIVITSDLNFFGGVFERNQAFIDGGLFAMQFVMGLHCQKIATCCKMYIRTPKIDRDFYKITNINTKEVPIMLILIGHYSETIVKAPYSYRFPVNKILNYHE
jgi:nitroreductase